MKKFFIFLLLVLIILFLIYIFSLKNQNFISNETIKQENINIEYPFFNNKIIDNYISDYLESLITNFKYNNYSYLFVDYDYKEIENVIYLDIYNYTTLDNLIRNNTKSLEINMKNNNITSIKNSPVSKEYDLYTNTVIDKNKPIIALTFDDGPNHNTSKVIDILNKYNIKATFFVLGTNIKDNTDIIEKMFESKMEIGNHSYSHKLLTNLTKEQIEEEFTKTSNLIFDITGKYPTLTRPGYGSTNKLVKESINTPIIDWNIDTLDWKYHSSSYISKTILNKVTDGNIILMHDIYTATYNALDIVIPKLLEKGYQLVTVSELFYYKNIDLQNHKVYRYAK